MNTRLELIDVQWTVVSLSPAPGLFEDAKRRATANNWSIQSWSVTNGAGDEISQSSEWPHSTLGSMTIDIGHSNDMRNFFWSTFATHYGTNVSGGLYIGQYARELAGLNAYIRAMATLKALFQTEQTVCIVLTLEDDLGLDLGPGILGRYRRDTWHAMGLESETLPGLEVKLEDPEWIEAVPVELKETGYLSVHDMSEQTKGSICEIQNRLEDYLRIPRNPTTHSTGKRPPRVAGDADGPGGAGRESSMQGS